MDSDPSNETAGRSREWISVIALVIAMILATGPGVLLVNRPATIFGLPLIYAWGILWFFIMGSIALATDRLIWRPESERGDGKEGEDDS